MGGLFRHVLDLAGEQAARGHAVGIVADSLTSDSLTLEKFARIEPRLALGLHRIAMNRKPGIGDGAAARATQKIASNVKAGVIHGHGAKGGAFARLAVAGLKLGRGPVPRCFYTPHGGTLHFSPRSAEGIFYFGVERLLARVTDGLIFESAYSRRIYDEKVGLRGRPSRVIPNGLSDDDFQSIVPAKDAADVLFVGELRHLKGVDVLLRALEQLNKERPVTAVIVGGGPEAEAFKALALSLGLDQRVTFPGVMPARDAFKLGRLIVVPSRAESFPYIVLEAAAAGLPILASNVGGIPEIVAGTDMALLTPGDADVLTRRLADALSAPERMAAQAQRLKEAVSRSFTTGRMTDAVLAFYASAFTNH